MATAMARSPIHAAPAAAAAAPAPVDAAAAAVVAASPAVAAPGARGAALACGRRSTLSSSRGAGFSRCSSRSKNNSSSFKLSSSSLLPTLLSPPPFLRPEKSRGGRAVAQASKPSAASKTGSEGEAGAESVSGEQSAAVVALADEAEEEGEEALALAGRGAISGDDGEEEEEGSAFCPVPQFTVGGSAITLFDPTARRSPIVWPLRYELESDQQGEREGVEEEEEREEEEEEEEEEGQQRPVLVYLPGMDCTGQGVFPQLPSLAAAGYDVRCLYVPTSDRSSWSDLVARVALLIHHAATASSSSRSYRAAAGTTPSQRHPGVDPPHSAPSRDTGGPRRRPVVLLAESFGACLALRIALRAPGLVSQLVLLNPATSFPQSNPLISLCAATGLLAFFPTPLYGLAQDIAFPLLVKWSRVGQQQQQQQSGQQQQPQQQQQQQQLQQDMLALEGSPRRRRGSSFSPIDYVPAPCASWRLQMLNDTAGLEDDRLRSLRVPTLLVASAKDRVLPSVDECGRLLSLLPNSRRVILSSCGHAALLEHGVDIAKTMRLNGFDITSLAHHDRDGQPPAPATAAAAKGLGRADDARAPAEEPPPSSTSVAGAAAESVGARDHTAAATAAAAITPGTAKSQPGSAPRVARYTAKSRGGRRKAVQVSRMILAGQAAEGGTEAAEFAGSSSDRTATQAGVGGWSSNGVPVRSLYPEAEETQSSPQGQAQNLISSNGAAKIIPNGTASSSSSSSSSSGGGGGGGSSSSSSSEGSRIELGIVEKNREYGNLPDQQPTLASGARAGKHKDGELLPVEKKDEGKRSKGKEEGRLPSVPDSVQDEFGKLFEAWRVLTSPLVVGDEHLEAVQEELLREGKRGVLFVGNHTLFGIYDTPLLLHELYMRGFPCRGLSHPGHWLTAIGNLMDRYGHVRASPFAAYRLLKQGESVLLFPGGSREVCKKKSEKYQLLWQPEPEFVRMAAVLNAIIVPFALVGADDAYNVMWDSDDILASPIGPVIRNFYSQNNLSDADVYPVTTLPGTSLPSLIPLPERVERVYVRFCNPIDVAAEASKRRKQATTAGFGTAEAAAVPMRRLRNDLQLWQELYAEVQQSVRDGIAEMQALQASDPERFLAPRLAAKVSRLLPDLTFADRMWGGRGGGRP